MPDSHSLEFELTTATPTAYEVLEMQAGEARNVLVSFDALLDAGVKLTGTPTITSATTTGGSAITGVVNVGLINSSEEAAVRLALMAAGGVPGTVDTGSFTPTTTVFEADDITEATADHYIGRVVMFTTGALADQVSTVTDYVKSGSNGKFTVDTLTEAPANNDTFILV